jgi:hypothetical protein
VGIESGDTFSVGILEEFCPKKRQFYEDFEPSIIILVRIHFGDIC